MANFDKEFNELQGEIIKRYYAEAEIMANKVGKLLGENTRDVLEKNKKRATGWLIRSVSSSVQKMIYGYLIKCFTGVDYAQYVYDDTKPHYPPLPKIRDWVVNKGLAQRALKRGRNKGKMVSIQHTSTRSITSMDEYWAVDQLARSIAWKIFKKGTKGIKFFDIALKQAWPVIEKEVQAFNSKF